MRRCQIYSLGVEANNGIIALFVLQLVITKKKGSLLDLWLQESANISAVRQQCINMATPQFEFSPSPTLEIFNTNFFLRRKPSTLYKFHFETLALQIPNFTMLPNLLVTFETHNNENYWRFLTYIWVFWKYKISLLPYMICYQCYLGSFKKQMRFSDVAKFFDSCNHKNDFPSMPFFESNLHKSQKSNPSHLPHASTNWMLHNFQSFHRSSPTDRQTKN